MVLSVGYQTSAAFFQSAFDENTAKIVEAILGPNVEIFGNGQCLYKEPVGGHPKHLHQDSAYFEHRYQGPRRHSELCRGYGLGKWGVTRRAGFTPTRTTQTY